MAALAVFSLLLLALGLGSSHPLSFSKNPDPLLLLGKNVVCPDKKSHCPSKNTCCPNQDGYGCCPREHAVCCSDQMHCCPHGYACEDNNMCRKTGSPSHPLIELASLPKEEELPIGCECLSYETCCANYYYSYSCCPSGYSVCCPDKIHCCPTGYHCDTYDQSECYKGDLTYPLTKLIYRPKLAKGVPVLKDRRPKDVPS